MSDYTNKTSDQDVENLDLNNEKKDLNDVQKDVVKTNLENLSTKAENIFESVNTIVTSFKEKMTENSKTIVGIVEMLRKFNLFDNFFSPVNEDGTPNERNVKINSWLETVYEIEYDLQKAPYLEFLTGIKNENNFKSELFLDSEYSTSVGIQSKIDSFLLDEQKKSKFKSLFDGKTIKGVIDKDLLATLLKDNTLSLTTTDFFDQKTGEILETIEQSKLESLFEIFFSNSEIKKSLGSVASKLITNYTTDSTNDKRIKSDQDIAFFLFATLCKPQYTENVTLYNILPSSLIVEEIEEEIEEVEEDLATNPATVTEDESEEEVEEDEEGLDTDIDYDNLVENKSLIEFVKNKIFKQESGGSYSAVNKNDGGSASIGIRQCNRNAGNALELLKEMYAKNQSLFEEKLAKSSWYIKFQNYISGGSDRKGAIWTEQDVSQFAELIENQEMKEVIDQDVEEYVDAHIQACLDAGIKDPKMIAYLGPINNFSPVAFNSIISQVQDKTSFEELNQKTVDYMSNMALSSPIAYGGKADYYAKNYQEMKSITDENILLA